MRRFAAATLSAGLLVLGAATQMRQLEMRVAVDEPRTQLGVGKV